MSPSSLMVHRVTSLPHDPPRHPPVLCSMWKVDMMDHEGEGWHMVDHEGEGDMVDHEGGG